MSVNTGKIMYPAKLCLLAGKRGEYPKGNAVTGGIHSCYANPGIERMEIVEGFMHTELQTSLKDHSFASIT
jgi:hypothetical protein